MAILGTGIDCVYPSRHRALARQVAEHGALLSEWPLGTSARPAHFPQRNRLIAGLARGVLVVEAAAQSGSLITARLANEMGRDVYAMPGSIHSALTKGCHRLIKEGAKLVESVDDVFDELGWAVGTRVDGPAGQADGTRPTSPTAPPRPAAAAATGPVAAAPRSQPAGLAARTRPPDEPALDADAQRVLQALGHDPAAPDVLAARTGLAAGRLQAALLTLELAGRIIGLPGGRIAPHFAEDGPARVGLDGVAAQNPIEP